MKRTALIAALLITTLTGIAQTAEQLVGQLKQRLAPDKRTALWDVKATRTNGVTILTGEVSSTELKAELDKAFAGQKVKNDVKALDESQPANKRWGLVKLSVASLRCEGKHSAEMATQAGMGTPVKVLDGEGDWLRVQLPDDYIAWMPVSSLKFCSDQQIGDWRKSRRFVVTVDNTKLLADTCTGDVMSDLVLSNILEFKGEVNGWVRLATPDGREGWVSANQVADFDQWKHQPFNLALIERTARHMLGCGYLWGGTSTKVTDCSGLTKVSYLANGIILQRDASQQALTGKKISDWHQCTLGDLLFFGNSTTGRVTHVGMYLRDGKYIHCSGQVKINSLDPSASDYLYSPLSISRIQGQIGTRGITAVANHPWYCASGTAHPVGWQNDTNNGIVLKFCK